MQAFVHPRTSQLRPRRFAPTASALPQRASCSDRRRLYLVTLTWSFSLFSLARILAYLPTLWAIQASADASQHSLWTWLTWFGSNLTMAAWLYEQGGQQPRRAVWVSLCNALMCAAIVVLIVVHRG